MVACTEEWASLLLVPSGNGVFIGAGGADFIRQAGRQSFWEGGETVLLIKW